MYRRDLNLEAETNDWLKLRERDRNRDRKKPSTLQSGNFVEFNRNLTLFGNGKEIALHCLHIVSPESSCVAGSRLLILNKM